MIFREAKTVIVPGRIDDAWREVMQLCVQDGWDFVVKGGSYVGQIRKQLEYVQIVIGQPGARPLSPILPPSITPTTSDEAIEKYFLNYLLSEKVAEKENYTYGSFVVPQIDSLIAILNKAKGNTNQACIAIGNQESIFLSDPPCLRLVSFKVVRERLVMSVFFRSWDLYAGLPENLGGLQLLKEYVLANLDFWCQDGPLIAYSDGLHIYEQYFSIVDLLNVDKITVEERAVREKKALGIL